MASNMHDRIAGALGYSKTTEVETEDMWRDTTVVAVRELGRRNEEFALREREIATMHRTNDLVRRFADTLANQQRQKIFGAPETIAPAQTPIVATSRDTPTGLDELGPESKPDPVMSHRDSSLHHAISAMRGEGKRMGMFTLGSDAI